MVVIPYILCPQVSRECHCGPWFFSEESIKVGKKEAGTSALNQAYDKLQVKRENYQTRYLLEMAQRKVGNSS